MGSELTAGGGGGVGGGVGGGNCSCYTPRENNCIKGSQRHVLHSNCLVFLSL